MSDNKISILYSSENILLTKKHTKQGTISYGDAKWYEAKNCKVSSLEGFEKLINTIHKKQNVALTFDEFIGYEKLAGVTNRGEIVVKDNIKKVRRVSEAFKTNPQNLICFDIDGWGEVESNWYEKPELAIKKWIDSFLPKQFSIADFFWKLSSSAGIKPGLRAHIWFWMNQSYSRKSIKNWIENALPKDSKVDASLYDSVRLIFTADPIFDGVVDPITNRMGYCCNFLSDRVFLELEHTKPTPTIDSESETDDDDWLLKVNTQPPIGLNKSEIRDAVWALDSDWCDDRTKWIEVGMSIHHETSGSDVGFSLWNEWSKQSQKYSEQNCIDNWKSFQSNKSGLVKTMASILKVVKDTGKSFEQLLQKLEMITNYRLALDEVAKYELDGIETETIVPIIKKIASNNGFSASPTTIKKAIHDAKKEYTNKTQGHRVKVLEDWLCSEVLRCNFKNGEHLMRYAKLFWYFDNGYWRTIESDNIANKVYELIVSTLSNKNGDVNETLSNTLIESSRVETLNSFTNSIVGIIEKKTANDMQDDPMLIRSFPSESIMNCKNGELLFENEQVFFKEHDPSNKLTSQIDAEYDPDATCPEWDAALLRIFEDYDDRDEVIDHLHELMGYICQTTRNFAIWSMFHGRGSNGKSFVAQVLQSLIGSNAAININLSKLSSPTKSNHLETQLVGKMLLVDDDFKKGALLPDESLKKLSEAKMLTADPKYGNAFNFVSKVTPLILTNHWPKTVDNSYGLTRRALVFDFKKQFNEDEKDLNLQRRIVENELSGILNKVIDGWSRLKSRGRFKVPQSCVKAKDKWLSERNIVSVFIYECLEITKSDSDVVEGDEVWFEFQNWSASEKSGGSFGRNSFYNELTTNTGITRSSDTSRKVVFKGFKIKNSASSFDDDLI